MPIICWHWYLAKFMNPIQIDLAHENYHDYKVSDLFKTVLSYLLGQIQFGGLTPIENANAIDDFLWY